VSAVCLFLWIVGSLHLKMPATEQHANKKFCVLLHKSPSETLWLLEEVYGKAAIKKMQVYKWYKCFWDGRPMSWKERKC
jgi:hypothetical protein